MWQLGFRLCCLGVARVAAPEFLISEAINVILHDVTGFRMAGVSWSVDHVSDTRIDREGGRRGVSVRCAAGAASPANGLVTVFNKASMLLGHGWPLLAAALSRFGVVIPALRPVFFD